MNDLKKNNIIVN